MGKEMLDKQKYNLMSYEKFINRKTTEEEEIKKFINRHENKIKAKSRIKNIKEEILEKKKVEEEKRLLKIIEIYYNLPEFRQEELLEKIQNFND